MIAKRRPILQGVSHTVLRYVRGIWVFVPAMLPCWRCDACFVGCGPYPPYFDLLGLVFLILSSPLHEDLVDEHHIVACYSSSTLGMCPQYLPCQLKSLSRSKTPNLYHRSLTCGQGAFDISCGIVLVASSRIEILPGSSTTRYAITAC